MGEIVIVNTLLLMGVSSSTGCSELLFFNSTVQDDTLVMKGKWLKE